MEKFLLKTKNEIKKIIFSNKVSPHIHWRNLLYVFSLIVVSLILFSFSLSYRIKNQQGFQITPKLTKSPSLINEKLLNKVNDSFLDKELRVKEIKEGIKLYKDPSIK